MVVEMRGGVLPFRGAGAPGLTRCAMWRLTVLALTTITWARRRRSHSSRRSTPSAR